MHLTEIDGTPGYLLTHLDELRHDQFQEDDQAEFSARNTQLLFYNFSRNFVPFKSSNVTSTNSTSLLKEHMHEDL